MTGAADVPPGLTAEVRAVCLGLPEVYEEPAWVGTRWRIRQRTFAHILTIDAGRPPAYARAAGTDGPATVLTFRCSDPDAEALGALGHPYFRARWGRELGGVILDDPDWDEVAELLVDSYCECAPRSLVRLVRSQSS